MRNYKWLEKGFCFTLDLQRREREAETGREKIFPTEVWDFLKEMTFKIVHEGWVWLRYIAKWEEEFWTLGSVLV